MALLLALSMSSASAQLPGNGGIPFTGKTPWTPVDASGASLVFTSVAANYTIIANLVFAYFTLTYPTNANGSNAEVSLPKAVPSGNVNETPVACFSTVGGIGVMVVPLPGTATAVLTNPATGATLTNTNVSAARLQCLVIYPMS